WIHWFKNTIRVIFPYPCMQCPPSGIKRVFIPLIIVSCKSFGGYMKRERTHWYCIFYRNQLKIAIILFVVDKNCWFCQVKYRTDKLSFQKMITHIWQYYHGVFSIAISECILYVLIFSCCCTNLLQFP